MTRPASDVLADLAACAARQAELTAELSAALRAAPAPAPTPAPQGAPENLTTAEAAALLGVSASHLKALRAEGRGPRYFYVGRSVRYPRSALSAETVRTPSEALASLPAVGVHSLKYR